MGKADYEYHGLMAETWDLFRGDTSEWEDRFFFKEMIDHYGQPVLDVGCGTGRLLLDYMAAIGYFAGYVGYLPTEGRVPQARAQAVPRRHDFDESAPKIPGHHRSILLISARHRSGRSFYCHEPLVRSAISGGCLSHVIHDF